MKNLLLTLLLITAVTFGQSNFTAPVKNKINKNAVDIQHSKGEKPIFITDSVKLHYKNLEKKVGENPIYDVIPNNKTIKAGSQSNNHLAYPILFVHGLSGDSKTWENMGDFLENAVGQTMSLRFSLNYDWNLSTSDMDEDVASFIPNNLGSYNLYKIDFNCKYDNTCYYGGSTSSKYSNQSGITKQGKAIGMAVDAILEATGKNKVILIGHSMGGLAIREYMQNDIHWLDNTHNIAKLITVGTPHSGADIELLGLDWLASGIFTDIRATSEAVRDLRSRYDIGNSQITSGAYIWDGYESQNYMDDNFTSSWDNVDVNCNGFQYEEITGINHKSIFNNVEYASIRDINDDVVTSNNVGWGWPDDYSAGEDFCWMLNHWSGEENRHCEGWGIDAVWDGEGLLSDGGHTNLPNYTSQNLWALDEPDDYDRAYSIEFDKRYAGFITPQADNAPYPVDYDDYQFYIPETGILNIDADFYTGSSGDAIYLYDLSTESYIDGIENVSSSEAISIELSPGYYIVEFKGTESEIEEFSQYYFSLNFQSTVGVLELQLTNFQLSPNPTQGYVSINFNSENDNASLWLTNTLGETIQVIESGSFHPGENKINFDTSTLNAGIYFVNLTVGGFHESKILSVIK